MKLFLASTALALGISVSAHAAQPATDHSQHQQHQQQAQPSLPQAKGGAAPTAPHGHMEHHGAMGQGMKMDGCCCCKKDAQGQMSCDDKAATPSATEHDHSN